MAKPIVVNDSDFAEKVLQSPTPVVVISGRRGAARAA